MTTLEAIVKVFESTKEVVVIGDLGDMTKAEAIGRLAEFGDANWNVDDTLYRGVINVWLSTAE